MHFICNLYAEHENIFKNICPKCAKMCKNDKYAKYAKKITAVCKNYENCAIFAVCSPHSNFNRQEHKKYAWGPFSNLLMNDFDRPVAESHLEVST